MARGLKFCIYEVEELYYLCSENKGADQLRGNADQLRSNPVTAKLICVFVFAFANNRFSHNDAQFIVAPWMSAQHTVIFKALKINFSNETL